MEASRIGESLKTARARLGWSREALAFNSGVSWSAIAQIESGRRKDVRLSSLSALANALGVSIDYLAGSTAALSPHLFEHRLLAYGSDEEYVESTVPYLTEGLEQSHAALVVAAPPQIALLREALEPWFEAGFEPVLAVASATEETAFVRAMLVPREWAGRRTISYVDPADEEKPKLQRATVFFDEPIEL